MPSVSKDSTPKKIKIKDDTELYNLLRANYSQAYNNWLKGSKIYRGCRSIGLYAIFETGKRKSKHISNVYTLLTSEFLPSWSEFPKRNRSFICTTKYDTARTYTGETGSVYYIFPENDTKIGICPAYDIWYGFLNIKKLINYNVPDFNNFLVEFMYIICRENVKYKNINKKYINELFSTENIKEIQQIFSVIDDEINNNIHIASKFYNNPVHYYIYRKIIENKSNLITILDNLLDAKDNSFKYVNIKDYEMDSSFFDREIWCGGKCMFVNCAYFNEIMSETE